MLKSRESSVGFWRTEMRYERESKGFSSQGFSNATVDRDERKLSADLHFELFTIKLIFRR